MRRTRASRFLQWSIGLSRSGCFRALWKGGAGPQLGDARKLARGEGVMGRGGGDDSGPEQSDEDSEAPDSEDDLGERLPAITSARLKGRGAVLWEVE